MILAFFGAYLCFSVFSEQLNISISTRTPDGVYNQLATNLLKGKLYVPTEPVDAIKKLSNPYPPQLRMGLPFAWDQSYYNGHYYLYWGIAPVLTFNIPYYLLTGSFPAERIQGLWFALLAFIFAYFLIKELIKKHTGDDPDRFASFLIAGAFITCTDYGGVSRRINVYETAIFAGVAFLFAGYYVLARRDASRKAPVIAGVLFGLAFASRPTAICGALVLPALIRDWRAFFKICAGFAPVGLMVALYNYLRFENPFEFGFKYQMCNFDMSQWGYKTTNVLYAFGSYLFQPFFSRTDFPFLRREVFGQSWLIPRHEYMNEPIVGLLFLCPMILLTIPALNRAIKWREHAVLYMFMLAGFASMLINSIAGVSQRYSAEFASFFVAATLIAVFVAAPRTRSWFWRIPVTGLILYSINASYFVSFSIWPTQIASMSPRAYAALVRFYSPRTASQQPPVRSYVPAWYTPELLMRRDRCESPRQPPMSRI